ncbi:hypothetical protein GGR51DRAFT_164170 [Nemania sp. FL0031]|nr:hypothetical protein GGR51DRAFT_164170 [Nemania sp. FL0031]
MMTVVFAHVTTTVLLRLSEAKAMFLQQKPRYPSTLICQTGTRHLQPTKAEVTSLVRSSHIGRGSHKEAFEVGTGTNISFTPQPSASNLTYL